MSPCSPWRWHRSRQASPPPGAGGRAGVRLRGNRRTRHPQHRLRRDERPHRLARRGADARRQAPAVRRRRQRRRLEVARRRHHVHAGLRRAAGAVDRRGRDRPAQSGNGLGRHRRGLDAQQRVDRRRHLQDDRRRRHLDEPRPARLRAHRRRPHRSAQQRHRVRVRHRASSGAIRPTAASTRPPTAARRGSRCSRARMPRPVVRA